MVSWVTSTPSGSNDRMISLASWATTPTPPAPSPPVSASRTPGSADSGMSGSVPGPRYTTATGGGPSVTASPATARPSRGDRPGSPDQRAERATLPVVAHDAKEIMRSLLPLGVDVTQLTMDTAVAAYLLDPSNDRYRVTDLAARFLGVAVDDGGGGKGQGAFLLEPPPDPSAGPDVADTPDSPGVTDGPADPVDAFAMAEIRLTAVLARLRAPLVEALADEGQFDLVEEIELPLVRVLARMEVVGIPVDREVLRSIAAGLAEECRVLEATIHELAGAPFKINSVPQLRAVLYDQLGLTPARKTKTGFSTDARTLELLRGQHPIIEALLRYREIEKLRSTYGESLAAEVAPDGRIHATFRQTVARTGRLSSDRPNLHNIPVR